MNELLIDLDASAKTALYEQIYGYIRRNIMDGRLSQGERLPSARLLAENLQVSRSTVDAAYGQLVSEGYLKAKRGSGYYVCDIGSLYGFQEMGRRMPASGGLEGHGLNGCGLDCHGADSCGRDGCGLIQGMDAGCEPAGISYNFLPGQIDSQAFPYNAWRKCAKEALLDLEAGQRLLQAGHPQGEYRFREAVADYLYRSRGVICEPGQMVVGAGNEYLLQLLGQILGTPRKVAMESPTYLQAYHTFRNIGYEVEAVPMDADGMRVEEIPKDGVGLAYVMPSHQFPLGPVMPLGRRLQLLAWAKGGPGRYIIEDDHDSEFRYKGKPIPSLQGIAKAGRVIYLGTFSNSIMPSVRISYMVLPPQLLAVYHEKCGFYASTVSKIQQMAVCRFIEDGYFGRHLNKMRGIYKGKRDMLLQILKGKGWVDKVYGDHAGLHIAVELDSPLTEGEVILKARKRGLKVQGMSGCYIAGRHKPDANPVLLLGFGNLSEKQIREGVEILGECVLC